MPWLGDRADRLAILALTLYALLPIIRNTYTGIAELTARRRGRRAAWASPTGSFSTKWSCPWR